MRTQQHGTMTVTVRDHRTEDLSWGHGPHHVVVRRVTISAFCPQCGRPRGKPRWARYHDDGVWYSVQVWNNPCGHLDMYESVLAESRRMEHP